MSFCLILLAAGKSSRFNSNLAKPYHKIGQKTLLEIILNKTSKIKEFKNTVIVYNKKHLNLLKKLNLKNVTLLQGGLTRQSSTLIALKYLKKMNKKIKKILIHDVARPNVSTNLFKKIIKNSKKNNTVIPIIEIKDAIKQKYDNHKFEYIVGRNRKDFFLTQTPQSFNLNEIHGLHVNNKDKYLDDDLSLLEDLSNVKFIEGERNNFKITNKIDYLNLKNIYKTRVSVGLGFDIHRLVPNRKFYLGGLIIKSKLGTLGHSDGDPVLHTVTDAILGACRMGDIGQMFSDKNKKFKNIRSTILLKQVMNKIKLQGYFIKSMDINIITQTPKIKKYKNRIINNLSALCELSKKEINIKGKTTEKLGIIGREKAIACEAIISVIKYE